MAPVEGAGNAPAAREVLDYLFSPDGEALVNARGFHPSPLLVGGDWTAVPEKLRRYVDGSLMERTLPLTVTIPRHTCSVSRLSVSGDGVTVRSATPLPLSRCRLELHVAAAATGDRDLVVKLVTRPITINYTIRGVVRLSFT